MTSTSDLLAATDAAILKTLTAQEYNAPGGRRKQMARLSELKQFRRELVDEVANASGGSMCSLLSLRDAT